MYLGDMLKKSSSPKTFWGLVKKLMSSTGSSNAITSLLDQTTNEFIVDDEKKADLLNRYFSFISTISDEIHVVPNFLPKSEKTLYDVRINISDVMDILKHLEQHVAKRPDMTV